MLSKQVSAAIALDNKGRVDVDVNSHQLKHELNATSLNDIPNDLLNDDESKYLTRDILLYRHA